MSSERLTAEELADIKRYFCLRFSRDSSSIPANAGLLFNKLIAAAEERERLRAENTELTESNDQLLERAERMRLVKLEVVSGECERLRAAIAEHHNEAMKIWSSSEPYRPQNAIDDKLWKVLK